MNFLNMENRIMYHHAGGGSSAAIAHNNAHDSERSRSLMTAIPAGMNDHQKAIKKIVATNAELPEADQDKHESLVSIREKEMEILKTIFSPDLL